MGLFSEKFNNLKNKATNIIEENNLDEKFENVKSTIEQKTKDAKLDEKFSSAKDSLKKTWDQSTESLKENSKENKELKKPLEGAIIRYEVIYIGGLPEYPKVKHGNAIALNIMTDRFAFRKTGTSKDWFNDYDIYYNQITEITIEKRNISTAEMLLGAGNDANQQQENVICIAFSKDDKDLMLRVEMLTGVTIYNQAAKCKEFLDILRQNNILKIIKQNSKDSSVNTNNNDDIFEQIKKLASLKDAGIISEEEYSEKKADLLKKI